MRFYYPILFNLFIILMYSWQGYSQSQGLVYQPFDDAIVSQNGQALTAPWCGGINATQINHADLNGDSKKDLILYDFNTNTLKTFLNTGNAGEIKYVHAPKYAKNFPPILDYLILKDYNCDGIPDLFHKGFFGVSVYKGYYQNNELKFTFYKDLFFQGPFGTVNVYVQPSDIPSIIDIDNDGDLDILAYDVFGSKITWYKNMRVEQALPCDSIIMTEFDLCWGKFYQGIARTMSLNISCKGGEASGKKYRHTGNTIVHLDIDGDGDYDLLGGNISYNDIQLLYNSNTNMIIAQDTNYNQNGHKLELPSWPSPAHVDIDNDGDRDIIVTTHSDNLSTANYNNVAWYKNNGTDANPVFVYQHDTLLTPQMIDVGSFSYPTFFDYDKDGKPDLFVGTEGYFNNASATLTSKMAYYRNTSTSGNSSFELITKDFLNLSTSNYNGIFPTFGDVTGDGVDDLVLGNVDGNIKVYRNFAPNNNVQPNFIFLTDSLPGVDVGSHSMPLVFDFNQDGKTDLLVGNKLGKIVYFEDTSSTNQKKLALTTISLGNVSAGSVGQLFGYAAPTIAKMDNLQKEYLVLGNVDGTIERYDNFKNNWGSFQKVDSNYSMIQTTFRSVPAIADIDGNGQFEMVVGNSLGGLHYYKQVLNVVGVPELAFNPLLVDIYPNPASTVLYIRFQQELTETSMSAALFDISGRCVQKHKLVSDRVNQLSLEGLSHGLYVLQIQAGSNRLCKKVFVMP